MDISSLGFRTDLALAESAGALIEHRDNHVVVRTPDNPTYRWGNFILIGESPPITEAEFWFDVFDREFPEAEHRAVGRDGTRGTLADLAPLKAAGMSLDLSAVMTARHLTDPLRLNTEAEFRALSSDDDWEQRIELQLVVNETEEPDAYREFSTRKTAAVRELVEAGQGAWFGAFLDDQLVSSLGILRAGEGLARFQSVETDPDFRRGGLAGNLVHLASRYALDELEAKTLVMVADPTYQAIRIYRSLGFGQTETMLQAEQVGGAAANHLR